MSHPILEEISGSGGFPFRKVDIMTLGGAPVLVGAVIIESVAGNPPDVENIETWYWNPGVSLAAGFQFKVVSETNVRPPAPGGPMKSWAVNFNTSNWHNAPNAVLGKFPGNPQNFSRVGNNNSKHLISLSLPTPTVAGVMNWYTTAGKLKALFKPNSPIGTTVNYVPLANPVTVDGLQEYTDAIPAQ